MLLTVALPPFEYGIYLCGRCADLTEQAKKAGIKFKVDMLVTPGSELVRQLVPFWCCMM